MVLNDISKDFNHIISIMITYIIHYTPLNERKKHILKELQQYSINAEFITEFDKESLDINQLTLFNTKLVTYSEISYFYKQLYCYLKIKNENINVALILDDDCILDNNFTEKLNFYINKLPQDWDICYISDICNFHIADNIIKNNIPNVFLKSNEQELLNGVLSHGSTRGPAYLITNTAANKIITNFNNIKMNEDIIEKPHDHWLNDVFREMNFKIYWAEPTIVKQGTIIRIFKNSY